MTQSSAATGRVSDPVVYTEIMAWLREKLGDTPGHAFRGNQWKRVGSAGGPSAEDVDTGVPGTSASSTPWRERDYELGFGDVVPKMSAEDFAKASAYHAAKSAEMLKAEEELEQAEAKWRAATMAGGANVENEPETIKLREAAGEAEAAREKLGTSGALDASMGVTFWHEKMAQDPALLEKVMDEMSGDWQHIGGDGPMRVRWAAQMAFGLEEGVAYDSKKGREVQLDEMDPAKVVKFAAAMRHEYEQSQSDLDDGVKMGTGDGKSNEDAYEEWVQSTDFDSWRDDQQESDWRSMSDSEKADYVDDDDVRQWADENEDVAGKKPGIVPAITSAVSVDNMSMSLMIRANYEPNLAPFAERVHSTSSKIRDMDIELESVRRKWLDNADTLRREKRPEESDVEFARRIVDARAEYESAGKKRVELKRELSDQWTKLDEDLEATRAFTGLNDDEFVRKFYRSDSEKVKAQHKANLDEYYNDAKSEYASLDPDGRVFEKWSESYETPDDSGAFSEWKSAKGYDTDTDSSVRVSIDKNDWPQILYRGVQSSAQLKVHNFVESWSADEDTAYGFGTKMLRKNIDRSRILVFQGAKFWRTKEGGMGSKEYEFMVMSDVPKWLRDQQKKAEKHGEIANGKIDKNSVEYASIMERHGDLTGHKFHGNQHVYVGSDGSTEAKMHKETDIQHLEIDGRAFAAQRVSVKGKPGWAIAGKSGAQYFAIKPSNTDQLSLFNIKHLPVNPFPGSHLEDRDGVLKVIRHPGGNDPDGPKDPPKPRPKKPTPKFDATIDLESALKDSIAPTSSLRAGIPPSPKFGTQEFRDLQAEWRADDGSKPMSRQ